jgi:thiamine pyrophosphate-dependent acetolactate synthase large subunit-like protein
VSPTTARARLGRILRRAGLDQLYGEPDDGFDVVACGGPPEVAVALAAAHEQVHLSPAGVCLADGSIELGVGRTGSPEVLRIDAAADLDELADRLSCGLSELAAPLVIEWTLDPSTVVDDDRVAPASGRSRWVEPDDEVLARLRDAQRPMLVVGPGVVAADAVADLHALAASADLGVLNTWGAKGVFDWRSRHHWATVGLQARDLELGGVPESDLVLLSGIDADELSGAGDLGPATLTVAPEALGPLAERWSRSSDGRPMPALRDRLAAVTQAGWQREQAPLTPTRVTRQYGELAGTAGFVAADPGLAGFWVARTFATTRLGGAKVPARRTAPGAAIAATIAARLRHPAMRTLAVGDGPLDDHELELLDAAGRLGIPLLVERWSDDGEALDSVRHARKLRDALDAGGRAVITLATDPGQLVEIEEAAGPVTAWGGLGR